MLRVMNKGMKDSNGTFLFVPEKRDTPKSHAIFFDRGDR